MKPRSLLRLLLYAVLALVFLSFPQTATAEGPGVGGRRIQLENEPAGPYLLRVVSSPTPPLVENLYLEVRVIEAFTGILIEDAIVQTSARPHDAESPRLEALATHDIAPNPAEYAAHLPVPDAGLWMIHVDVEGSAGSGTVSFLVQVNNPSSIGPVIAVGAPIAGLILLAGMFFWLQRNESAESQPPSR